MNKFVILTVVSIFLSGCATGSITKDYVLDSKKEAVFVIGTNNNQYRMEISKGTIVDGKFVLTTPAAPVVFSMPKDNFIVAKAPIGATLALVKIDGSFACEESNTFVFSLDSGGVYYLTDIILTDTRYGFDFKLSKNIERAKSYMQTHYPNIGSDLQILKYELMPRNTPCTKVIHIWVPAV